MVRSDSSSRTFILVGLLGLLVLGGVGGFLYLGRPALEDTDPRKTEVKDFVMADVLEVPYIFWGGDVATYLANGGDTTQVGSLVYKHGLKLKLSRGDDFGKQVAAYKAGKSPFLRGTMSMLGQVAEDVCGDGRGKPVVFLQLTWSAGDHVVARTTVKTLNDLKGKKITLQKDGPHVGMLDDILHTAQFAWSDVNVVWTDDVTGDKGPAELFRKDPSIDACFVVTPDMAGLTGGDEQIGSGVGTTVKGARVLVSTKQMLRSIADVYACRKDFYDKHRDVVEKFVAAYLKAVEELLAARKDCKPKQPSAKYNKALKFAQKMFGKDVKTNEDADGLIADAVFVGLPGNYAFFRDPGNLAGFAAKHKAALDLADSLGAKKRHEFLAAELEYADIKKLGELTAVVDPPRSARFSANPKERNTLYHFNVYFGGGQSHFPEVKYGKDFQRAVEQASLFANAIILIRGHANPAGLTDTMKQHVLRAGFVTPRGGDHVLKNGKKIDLNNIRQLVDLIHKEKLADTPFRVQLIPPVQPPTYQGCLDMLLRLSKDRAESVRQAVLQYATGRAYRLDQSQMKWDGVGGLEPVFPYPKDDRTEGARNRRVEFRIVQVAAEDVRVGDSFDY